MKRKKWTPQTEITDSLLKFREKRKWQLALRRYVLEQMPSPQYAPYFGLTITDFRKWIELQLGEGLTWENFGSEWQFDHIVPVTYFDYSLEDDLRLCWNFVNIRIEKIDPNKNRGYRVDVLAVKVYFENLYKKTEYRQCLKMLEKIVSIENSNIISEPAIEAFITERKEYLNIAPTLSVEEFNTLNTGTTLQEVLLEKEMLRKFGYKQNP